MITKNLIYSNRFNGVQNPTLVLANKSVSCDELENIANGFAHFLTETGLEGERIVFMLPNSVEIISIYLGCFKAGCIAMPINRRYAPPVPYLKELEALHNSSASVFS
ncbi:long-chain fatty acid--CoA ligase [Legionella sp. PATHC035]|uniref:AMP-binding protein n=1 Tax=Legionella sp. PATHC035 TaxID=2992040 RepID=UPI0022430C63|nr:AMP-binding protein [Legionella sp. PATHC035]MCW8408080.1 long-chain fatty acid--CoA ligase [Legionella sp. PATHC035]